MKHFFVTFLIISSSGFASALDSAGIDVVKRQWVERGLLAAQGIDKLQKELSENIPR
jgi:hypothetical protein